MVDVVYLEPDTSRPKGDERENWLYIDGDQGRDLGAGGAWKATGEWVGYCSLPEDDVNLKRALQAAEK